MARGKWNRGKDVRAWAALTALILLMSSCAYADIPEDKAIRAIIGEASGEGYDGMLAVAVGLRNRNSLKGVYGIAAPHVDNEPKWVFDLAEKAWEESSWNKIHSGTHWESIKFKEPYWAKSMIKVYQYKHHIFYRKE